MLDGGQESAPRPQIFCCNGAYGRYVHGVHQEKQSRWIINLCLENEYDRRSHTFLSSSFSLHYIPVELHHDRCDVTANLSLSNSSDYEGGGTIIADMGRVIKLDKGEVLLHPGSLVHGGMDIYKGTRFLLVTFAHFE